MANHPATEVEGLYIPTLETVDSSTGDCFQLHQMEVVEGRRLINVNIVIYKQTAAEQMKGC